MTVFDVDIVSDTVCPWCYIGYKRFEKARELYQKTYPGGSKDTFNIKWKAYYLKPDAPLESELMQERMVCRMGLERAISAQQHMTALGRAEGIRIGYGGRTGNTRTSHQLLHFAGTKGQEKQTEVALELFRLHFSEDGDITDVQMTLDAAKNCNLDLDEVKAALDSPSVGEEVDAEAASMRESGVRWVPQFRFQDGEHVVDGAGDVERFFELLIKIKEGSNSD